MGFSDVFFSKENLLVGVLTIGDFGFGDFGLFFMQSLFLLSSKSAELMQLVTARTTFVDSLESFDRFVASIFLFEDELFTASSYKPFLKRTTCSSSLTTSSSKTATSAKSSKI